MTKKEKRFHGVRFSADTIKAAAELVRKLVGMGKEDIPTLVTEQGNETVDWGSEEEFFAAYRKGAERMRFGIKSHNPPVTLSIYNNPMVPTSVYVTVQAQSVREIERVFEIFEAAYPTSRVPEVEPPKPKIFIGHGRDPQWKELKDHLHEKHGYDLVFYEFGARAGHSVRDVLSTMLEESSCALLVMTAEDVDVAGGLHARENVVHELGLFQGKLGFEKAIAILEEGANEFSNINGVDQIRFKRGNIRECFGEVVATLRRLERQP